MPSVEDLWNHKTELRGRQETALDILKWANIRATNAEKKADAALKAITGLLSVQIPAPDEDGKTYSVASWLVYANRYAKEAAGDTDQILTEIDPEALAEAVAAASAGVNAQAVADRLTVEVKPE